MGLSVFACVHECANSMKPYTIWVMLIDKYVAYNYWKRLHIFVRVNVLLYIFSQMKCWVDDMYIQIELFRFL